MEIGPGGFRELEAIRPPRTGAGEGVGPGAAERPGAPAPSAPTAPSFGEALEGAIAAVEDTNRVAETAAIDYVTGERGDLHNVILQMERADLTFQTMLQVRNKLLDAYREIMRMQV